MLSALDNSPALWCWAANSIAFGMVSVCCCPVGTGGSSGVDYLDMTTKYRVFVDLWSVRSILIKKSALPELQSPEFYGFKGDWLIDLGGKRALVCGGTKGIGKAAAIALKGCGASVVVLSRTASGNDTIACDMEDIDLLTTSIKTNYYY